MSGRWDSMNALRCKWDRVALIKKGRFDHRTAYFAVCTDDVNAKEAVALWLRRELRNLRDSKKTTVSRVKIADLAMAMLEKTTVSRVKIADLAMASGSTGSYAPIGENLLGLLRELLGVDVHRKRIIPNHKLMDAALIDGLALQNGKLLGVRELARRVEVSPRAIVDWRKSPIYHREIATGLGTTPRDVANIFGNSRLIRSDRPMKGNNSR
jgi:hypothetical protein